MAVNVAVPAADSGLVPIVAVPLRKVTVPVGVPAPGAVTETVAVKVTACPTADGFGEEDNDVVVFALLYLQYCGTVCCYSLDHCSLCG